MSFASTLKRGTIIMSYKNMPAKPWASPKDAVFGTLYYFTLFTTKRADVSF